MGKIKPSEFAAHFDVKPLIPPTKAKFSRPPKKKKFRLKLRFNQSSTSKQVAHKVKVERQSRDVAGDDFWAKPIIPFFQVKQEPQLYIKQEPAHVTKIPTRTPPNQVDFFQRSWDPVEEFDGGDPTYTPSDELSVPSSDDDSAYFQPDVLFESDDVLRVKPINSRKMKVKKEKKVKKTTKKPRRRYKRRVLTDTEKLQASRRRRTCLVKKPKSQYLGVSWCNTKNTWVARVWHPTERKLIWAGYHQNERACALAVNEKCLDLKIPLKNPHIVSQMD